MRLLRALALTSLLAGGLAVPANAATPAEVQETFGLSVGLAGDGAGTVTSSPGGIDCGPDTVECFAEYDEGTEVTLIATTGDQSTFVGWDGACTGTGSCVVTMSEAREVWAEFDALVLDVTVEGDGLGAVASDPAGIACDDESFDCSEAYASGTVVTLTATVGDDDSVFLGWDGACSGTGTCVVTVDADVEVSATFDTAWLDVEPIGDGSGVVTSDTGGISCGGDSSACTDSYLPGSEVTLTAASGDGSVFVGWSGACTGTGPCQVNLDDDALVMAEFDTSYVTVQRAGDGLGTVTSSTGDISCPPTCFDNYLPGTEVTLTATPGAASVFTGWSGACAGTGETCVLVADADRLATASFDTGRVTARTAGDGNGGTITSNPGGITCPGDCRESFLPSTQVTLVAEGGDRSLFTGWTGSCTGTGTCVVDAGADPTATATFDSARLRVSRTGDGAGSITSEPSGIDCGEDCNEGFLPGTTVTLIPNEEAGSTFAGWTGACTGLGECVIDLDDDSEVTAAFNPPGVGGKIAYECNNDICVMNEDGTDQRNLTNTPSDQEYAPTLSKDGARVAFMSNAALEHNPDRNIEIAAIDVDGTGLVQVTDSEGPAWDAWHNYDPDWSPDGTKIAFVTTRESNQLQRQIYTINADGTDETMITDDADQVTRLGPKWSPDGTKIAYTWWLGGQDVYVMNADGSGQTNLTPDTLWTRELSPAWSPDGTRIAYGTDLHYDPRTFNEEIYIMDADGSNKIRLTEHPAIDESPTWSPDGQWVAFSRYGDIWAARAPEPGQLDSWTAEADLKQLTSGGGVELEPTWEGPGQVRPMVDLEVRKTGNGKGRVTSTPSGIRCGKDCAEPFLTGSQITLVAKAKPGSRLVGWSRACPASGSCLITVDAGTRVKVRFERVPTVSNRLDKLQ